MRDAELKKLREENVLLMEEAAVLFDQLNAVWTKAEEHIREFGVLKPVHVPITMLDEEGYIGVQKHQGKWRICLGKGTMTENDIVWTPMSETNIGYRSFLLPKVELLYAAIVAGNKEVITDLKRAIKELT